MTLCAHKFNSIVLESDDRVGNEWGTRRPEIGSYEHREMLRRARAPENGVASAGR